ncbi:hypothetical protein MKY24_08715 [Paenibacillus sp. FSL P2-0322]|jgi:hypothetical protein|uniref:Uncharacterized protein n=1 Tax=Paenibacillus polymyxa TaxID=1406 RepID=A0AAP3ZVL7_PAEPO|nr:hypothetical protein [Paenibacillus polymyxa]MDH2329788.1 hypothetical protein [Paenibacillus polymyxa]
MKKAVFSTLGLALLLSTSTAVASAQEAAPALQKESIQLSGMGLTESLIIALKKQAKFF